jgi:hypothetical protein
MFSAECQAEMQDLVTDISLLYEYESKSMNERFLWNAWKQAENKNKTLLKNMNPTITGCETGILEPECITNTQSETIIHNKIHTDIQSKRAV